MGLDDAIRRQANIKATTDVANAQRSSAVANRAALANQLLHTLATETLSLVKQRQCPRALEIIPTGKRGMAGWGDLKFKTGRIIWLVQKTHTFGGQFGGPGLLHSGEFVSFATAERGLAIPSANIKSAVQQANCSSAVTDIRKITAHDAPSDYSARFYLDASNRLFYGAGHICEPAEDHIAKLLL